MKTLIAFVRSLLFTILFYGGSTLFVIVGAAIGYISLPAMRAIAGSWGRFHYRCTRWLLGIRVRVEGRFADEPVLYAFKHESVFETIELLRIFQQPVVVAKRELASIPLWGSIAGRYGLIFVDRSGGAGALRGMMKAVKGFINAGRPIIIFPEGTSVPPGQTPPLQSGFAGLYKLFGLPVVPVALDSGKLFPRHGFLKHSGTITYRIGDPIPAGLDREEIQRRVHEAINVLNGIERRD